MTRKLLYVFLLMLLVCSCKPTFQRHFEVIDYDGKVYQCDGRVVVRHGIVRFRSNGQIIFIGGNFTVHEKE